MKSTIEKRLKRNVELSVRPDRVGACLQRLSEVEAILEENIDGPLVYEFAHVRRLGNLVLPFRRHISLGRIYNDELTVSGRHLFIPAESIAYSSLYDGKLTDGYRGGSYHSMYIENTLNMHINGDRAGAIGLIVGQEAVEQFMSAIPSDQAAIFQAAV